MSGIIIKNLSEVLAAIDGSAKKIEQGAQIGIMRAGLAVERQAKLNFQSTRSYEKRVSRNGIGYLVVTPPKHVGGSGPNTVTGNLKRSIRTTYRVGFGSYIAEVGPTMVYGRQVEKGGGKWRSGVKYPYLEPAALTLLKNGTINRIFITAVKEKLGKQRMADLIPPMLIKLQADVNDLKVGLAQAENALKGVDKSVATASTGMTNFVTKMKQVGATMGVAFAGQQIVQFGKDVIMAASDMNESLSKVGVVFGQSSDEVVAWSKNSAQALGLSSQKALEAAGTYGNLFQAFGLGQGQAKEMSTSLVQLAADMASFNNTSIDDAILALRSGLSGETEPLKRFGVALNDVRLKEQAMSMGLIKTATGPLPVAAKAQAAYALILHDTTLAQGDYARTADGAANTMKSLAAEFQNAKVALGNALLPAFKGLLSILKLIVPLLTGVGNFFKDNADAIRTYTVFVLALTGAFLAFKAAVIATRSAVAAYNLVMAAHNAGISVAKMLTAGFRTQMLLLNAAIKANPIGFIVSALMLLGAAFVWAWKKSDTFRSVVVTGAQGIMYAFAGIVGAISKVLGIIGKIPGFGWAKGLSKGAEDFANKINIAGKNLADLKRGVQAGYGEGAFTYGGGGTGSGGTGGGKGGSSKGGLTTAEKSKLEGYKKDVLSIYKDMNEAIAEAQDKAKEALDERNEKMLKAHKEYDEKVADLKKRNQEALDAAQKAYDEKTFDINKTFDKRKIELEKDLQDKLADLREKAAVKSADLTRAAADKQISIIQQSMDRLRNAFASKTGFDIAEAFGGGASAKDALERLKKNLAAAKDLQANAATLAGMGYSQTFIEEVVKQGPEAGNEIAKALKEASPEATKELQGLYNEITNVSDHGLDQLAKSMNAGGKLATQELMNAYTQVAVDLKESLAEVDTELQKSLADANKAYEEAMTEAKTTRDEGLADALKAFNEAKAEAQKNLDEGLAEAQKTLQEALLEAQKDYEKAIDEINKSTAKKLQDLKDRLKEIADAMAAISKASASSVLSNAPVYTPITPVVPPGTNPTTPTAPVTQTNIDQTFITTKVDPYDVHLAVISGVKYGNAVTVGSNTGVSNKIKAMGLNVL